MIRVQLHQFDVSVRIGAMALQGKQALKAPAEVGVVGVEREREDLLRDGGGDVD